MFAKKSCPACNKLHTNKIFCSHQCYLSQVNRRILSPCLNCGLGSLNPKFCSKSCAAIVNNKISIKRIKKVKDVNKKPHGKVKSRIINADLITIVKNCNSLTEVLRKLGIQTSGSASKTLKDELNKRNIDFTHFNGKVWNKGGIGKRVSIEEYLNNKRKITSHKLRLKLLRDKIFLYECQNCKLSEWIDNPIPLELHHIDGNKNNNNLSNLMLLCPNCHVFTDTYKVRNRS